MHITKFRSSTGFTGFGWIGLIVLILFIFTVYNSKSTHSNPNSKLATSHQTEQILSSPATSDQSQSGRLLNPQAKIETSAPQETKPMWIFQGTVYDLVRGNPVSGAKLIFENNFVSGAGPKETTSDGGGAFNIEVPSLRENAYNIRIIHPDFDPQNVFTQDSYQKSKKERYRLGQGIQFGDPAGRFKGTESFSTNLNLYIYPHNLSPEERLEQADAYRDE